jgi:flavorubredoxin
MEGFHRRYILSGKALRLWAKMVRRLDIETVAPQHGAIFKGKEMVNKFIDWVSSLETGLDIMDNVYKIHTKRFVV